jgi:hypothetical protein
MTAGGTANAYVYYGTSDGGSNTNNWASVSAPAEVSDGEFSIQLTGLASNTFYYYRIYLTNSSGYAWTGESYAWMAQIRTRNGWSLASLPIDFGPGSNTLNSAAGTNLMDNMHWDDDSEEADNIWLQTNNGGWAYHWYSSNDNAWADEASAISTQSVQPGIGFWVKRADTGSVTLVTGLSGRPATNSALLTLFATNWSVFGWPYAAATTTNGSGSTNIGWGFAAIGGVTNENARDADIMYVDYQGAWYQLYLRPDSNWYYRATTTKATVPLQPGKAYYYYHRGTTEKNWRAPRY